MKSSFRKILALGTAMTIMFSVPVAAQTQSDKNDVEAKNDYYSEYAASFWSSPTLYSNGIKVESANILVDNKSINGDNFKVDTGSTLDFSINTYKSDKYSIFLSYKYKLENSAENVFEISVDGGERFYGTLPTLLRDESSEYRADKKGNELPPNQICIEDFSVSRIYNARTIDQSTLTFELDTATHKFSLKNTSQPIEINGIYISCDNEQPNYKEYIKKYSSKKIENQKITIEAEHYSMKSSASLLVNSEKDPALYPYESFVNKINVISTWNSVGQKALWEFDVKESGLYQLSFRYSQSSGGNMPVYRSIEIDGSVPFSELNTVLFPATKSGGYDNFTVEANGKPAFIYLEKGKHTVALEVTLGPLSKIYDELISLMAEMNELGMSLQKLSANSSDENRTWDIDEYMPTAVDDIKSFSKRTNNIYKKLKKINNSKATYANSLIYAVELLDKLADKPRTIPNNTDMLSVGDSSAAKYLGSVASSLVKQPISLDRIYFTSDIDDIPPAKVSFWSNLWESIKSFVYSFVYDPDEGNESKNDEEDIEVWATMSNLYLDVLQRILDESYDSQNKQNINLSIMPSEQKLILSNAAGTSPDAVIGLGYGSVFKMAIRGAAKDLTVYPELLNKYKNDYNTEALVPLCYGDGIYGLVESQDFQVLYYRKDILKTLGLKVPETYDDVKSMMPVLLRYSMNYYMPLAASGAYKSMNVTGPFMYQNNADFFSSNGMSTAIDSESSLNAFREMTDIFNVYAVQKATPSFYNGFRYGEIPIGIDGFGMYMQLETAAPELEGLWDIALVPGYKTEAGSILRYQMANSTSCMILESSKNADGAAEFLEWWLSVDTQLKFLNRIQTTLGNEYRWTTANLTAFKETSYSAEHKEIILNQWKAQKETPSHPASYMVEREMSNAWNNVIVNGYGLVESIDTATILSNREIIRKMNEFGFCDENGKILKDYEMATVSKINKIIERAVSK